MIYYVFLENRPDHIHCGRWMRTLLPCLLMSLNGRKIWMRCSSTRTANGGYQSLLKMGKEKSAITVDRETSNISRQVAGTKKASPIWGGFFVFKSTKY